MVRPALIPLGIVVFVVLASGSASVFAGQTNAPGAEPAAARTQPASHHTRAPRSHRAAPRTPAARGEPRGR